jgi:hypothetical protein
MTMTLNTKEAVALAEEYMANAVRTYKNTGHDPTLRPFYFRAYSFSEDVTGLRLLVECPSSPDNAHYVVSIADLERRHVQHKVNQFKVGDVQALATWITGQEKLGRAWSVPAWCVSGPEGLADQAHTNRTATNGGTDAS